MIVHCLIVHCLNVHCLKLWYNDLLLFTGPAIHMGVTVEAVVGTTQSPGAAVLHQGSVGSLILATLAL